MTRGALIFVLTTAILAAASAARAAADGAETNAPAASAPSALDRNALQLIVRNNIFDASRTGFHPHRPQPRVESFNFCGYALDQKPPAAFFSGSGAPSHAVEPGQKINGFTVETVDFASVKLKAAEGPELTLAMGASMRKVDNGPWKPAGDIAPEPADTSTVASTNAPGKATISASDSDIIKRLKARHNEDD